MSDEFGEWALYAYSTTKEEDPDFANSELIVRKAGKGKKNFQNAIQKIWEDPKVKRLTLSRYLKEVEMWFGMGIMHRQPDKSISPAH